MKITFVMANADMSGGARVIAAHAKMLRDKGHDVRVVSTPPRQPGIRDFARALYRGWDLPRWVKRSKTYFDAISIPHHQISRFRPVMDRDVPDADVVVATWWETAEWVSQLSARKGAKAYFIQGYEIWGGDPQRVNATWRLPLSKIVISRWLKDIARDQFGDPGAALVPNSVDLEQFDVPPRHRQPVPTVGTIYHLASLKACDVVLNAVQEARKEIPQLQLVTFGHYPESAQLPLPTGARHTVDPPQQSIKDIYAQCDVWINGSRTEGFCLPVLEAMACRCPVVSTKVGGPMDFLQEGRSGFLVDFDDVAAMADRILRVLRLSDDKWLEMSDAAFATACRYTWEDASRLMEHALQEVAGRVKFAAAG